MWRAVFPASYTATSRCCGVNVTEIVDWLLFLLLNAGSVLNKSSRATAEDEHVIPLMTTVHFSIAIKKVFLLLLGCSCCSCCDGGTSGD